MPRATLSVALSLLLAGSARAQVARPPEPAPAQPATTTGAPGAPRQDAAPLSPGSGPTIDLRPKWHIGDVTRYDMEIVKHNASKSPDDPNKKMGELYKQWGRLVRRVVAADASGTTLSLMYETLHLQAAYGTKVVHYSSDMGDNPDRQNELTPWVKACVGRPILVKLNAAGEVLSITGNEDPDASLPGADKMPHVPQAVLGDTPIRKLWAPLYALDRTEAKLGQEWFDEQKNADGKLGTFDVKLRNRLSEFKDGVATISTVADVDLYPATGPAAAKTKLTESAVSGSVEWDVTRGTLKTWSTSQEFKLDAEGRARKEKIETFITTDFKRVEPGSEPAGAAPAPAGAPAAQKP